MNLKYPAMLMSTVGLLAAAAAASGQQFAPAQEQAKPGGDVAKKPAEPAKEGDEAKMPEPPKKEEPTYDDDAAPPTRGSNYFGGTARSKPASDDDAAPPKRGSKYFGGTARSKPANDDDEPVNPNRASSPYVGDVRYDPNQPADDERSSLSAVESLLAHRVDELKRKFEGAKTDSQRNEIYKELAENLGKQFDVRQKRHGLEIEALETRVRKLKELVRRRQESREDIVSRRLDQILKELEGLGW